MSRYVEFDTDRQEFLCSNTGWGDVLEWSQDLDVEKFEELIRLIEHGGCDELVDLETQLVAAMEAYPTSPDITSTLGNLLELVKNREKAMAMVVTDGLSTVADSEETENEKEYGGQTETKNFDESEHPRGQPQNAGEFARAGGATPVHAALKVEPGPNSERVQKALEVIDSIHGDGNLPAIPVQMIPTPKKGERGFYRYDKKNGVARRIEVSHDGKTVNFDTVHEVWHFLDHHGFQTHNTSYSNTPGDFLTARMRWDEKTQPPDLQELVDALKKSPTLRKLRDLKGRKTITGRDGRKSKLDRGHLDYLLEPAEVTARAYAQYIAIRSQNPLLLKSLEYRFLTTQDTYPEHWKDAEFEPIATAFDRLFHAQGWLEKSEKKALDLINLEVETTLIPSPMTPLKSTELEELEAGFQKSYEPPRSPDPDDPLAPFWDEVLEKMDVLEMDEQQARFTVALNHGLSQGDCVGE